MAVTQIADIINPEVLGDQISAKFPDQLVFGNTNLVLTDSEFPIGSPGTQFKIPSWKRIPAFGALTENTPMTPGKIQSYSEFATVQRAGAAFEVLDTAELVSKADPVAEIADQISRRAAEYIDAALVTELEHTPNTFDQTNATVQTNSTNGGQMDQNALAKAVTSTLGDNFGKVMQGGALIVHSKVYNDLISLSAIQNQYQFGGDVMRTGMLPMVMGLPVLISDRVTVGSQSSKGLYHSYIVGPGALGLFYQRQVMVEFDRDILNMADIVASNVHFAAHLWGWDSFTSAVVAEQNKSIHAVVIYSY